MAYLLRGVQESEHFQWASQNVGSKLLVRLALGRPAESTRGSPSTVYLNDGGAFHES